MTDNAEQEMRDCPECEGTGEAYFSDGIQPDPYNDGDPLPSCEHCSGTGKIKDTRSALAKAVEKARGGPPPREKRGFA